MGEGIKYQIGSKHKSYFIGDLFTYAHKLILGDGEANPLARLAPCNIRAVGGFEEKGEGKKKKASEKMAQADWQW